MRDFFEDLPLGCSETVEPLSRAMFQLREGSKALLAPYAVSRAEDLLLAIEAGAQTEHPAYEHYLGAQAMQITYNDLRDQLRALLESL